LQAHFEQRISLSQSLIQAFALFQRIEMGAPLGNQNAAKAKKWAAAVERALCKRSGKDLAEALDDLADKFIAAVEGGDINGYRELADRLDGKPAQQVQLSGDENAPLKIIHESK
jgi:hypothetical protein